ncbi:hypothetical protein B0T14DRAFT_566466 [Immersiella caudata]|uniref:Uncharacterized protein n=1 Tax=Immersiella caudata TaxID=314043 RepID=A0AA39WQF7_9PEZI|nr:hypothetical protein B0T14DRAFT_566466 [Immersiella caudata]
MGDSMFVSVLARPEFAIFDFAPGETHTISSPEALPTARHLIEVFTVHCLDELGFGALDLRTHNAQLHSDLAAWCAEHATPPAAATLLKPTSLPPPSATSLSCPTTSTRTTTR